MTYLAICVYRQGRLLSQDYRDLLWRGHGRHLQGLGFGRVDAPLLLSVAGSPLLTLVLALFKAIDSEDGLGILVVDSHLVGGVFYRHVLIKERD